jgi:predicted CXXCH cytochrome family protein
MIRKKLSIAFLFSVLMASAVHAGSIVGSDHDLTAIGQSRQHAGDFFNDYQEVCVYCHTPHGADPAVPLWNRQIYQGSYTLYSSQTLNASMDQPPIMGVTRMCLSCHDGTIAVDALVNAPNRNWTVAPDHMKMEASDSPHGGTCGFCHMWFYENPPNVDVKPSLMTTDLSDDHPVSFVYNDALANADGALELPSSAPSGLGSTIRNDMLIDSRVECPTCHDVHDPDIFPFLIKANENSALCVTCHIK